MLTRLRFVRKLIPTKVKSLDGPRYDFSALRRVLDIKPEDVATVKSRELLVKIELEDLDLIFESEKVSRIWSCGAVRITIL